MSSKPRPIHITRPLRSAPDEAEPSFSYERDSYLGGKEMDVDDEFHRKLAGTRRETSGSSFWRSSTSSDASGPPLSSVNIQGKSNGQSKKQSGIAEALQPHDSSRRAPVSFVSCAS